MIVADSGNGAIRKISQDSVVTTIYNDPDPSFNPYGFLAVEHDCFLVSDSWSHVIRKLYPNGTVSVFVGSLKIPGFADGVGNSARFRYPLGMAKDSSGFFYVTEWGNNAIRKISPTGNVTTLAGGTAGFVNGVGREARFLRPHGIFADNSSELYVADTENSAIRKIHRNGTVVTILGLNGPGYVDGPLTQAKLRWPMMINLNNNNEVIFADPHNMAVRKIDRFGKVTTIIGSTTRVPDTLPSFILRYWYPTFFFEDDNGNFFVSSRTDSVWKFNCSSNSSSTNSSNAITLATPDAGLPSWEDVTIVDQLPYDSFPLEDSISDHTFPNLEATSSYQMTVTHTSESHYTETSATVLNPTETHTEKSISPPTTIMELFKHIFDLTTLPGLLTVIGSTSILLITFGSFLYYCIRRSRRHKAVQDFEIQPKFSTITDYSSTQSHSSYVQSVESSMSHSNRTATLFTDTQGTKVKKYFYCVE
jgi:hypothetical protein